MTLQSYPSHSEEVVASGASSSSSSASTSSTDVCPLPLSIGQKEIVLSNDERALIAELPDVNLLAPGANINITDSTNVDVGNRTTFNRDVTIYQIIQGSTLPEIQNGVAGHEEVVCNKNVKIVNPEDVRRYKTNHQYVKTRANKRKLCIILGSIVLLCLIAAVIAIVLHKKVIIIPDPQTNSTSACPATTTETESNPEPVDDILVTREGWGGVDAINSTSVPPATLVVIKHTGGSLCCDTKTCKTRVKDIQKTDMEEFQMPDIQYNFLIGADEKIYEGRGWEIQNEGRKDSLDIAFIGDFTQNVPSERMVDLARHIIMVGTRLKKINYGTFCIVSHNQTEQTDSPGENLFKEFIGFNHYSYEIHYNAASSDGQNSYFSCD